jgi:hypothetical protein
MLLCLASSASAITFGIDTGNNPLQLEQVQRAGASVYRFPLDMSQTSNGTNWSSYNPIFEAAWAHGITVEPVLTRFNGTSTPFPKSSEYASWKEWVKKAVQQYGVNGAFWSGKANPKPVTTWEVWNEPNLPENNPQLTEAQCKEKGLAVFKDKEGKFINCVQAQNYGQFLVETSSAIRAIHAGATVLMAGLYMPGGMYYATFWETADNVAGEPSSYNAVAIHPYAFFNKVPEMAERIESARFALENHVVGGAGKPLVINELGWPVANGDTNHPAVSEAQQATLLKESFDWIKANAAAKNISTVYWFNMQDDNIAPKWDHSCGLRTTSGDYRPAWFAFQEETGAPKWPVPLPPAPIPAGDDNLGGPHAIGQANGTLDIFYRNSTGGLGHNWYTSGGSWAEGPLSGSLAAGAVPHPVVQSNGTIDIFYRTPEGKLGHNWFDTGGAGWFSETLPGSVASDPHPVLQSNGTIDVFYRTTTGKLGHNWHGVGGSWAQADLPGSVAGDPYAVAQSNGTIDVFYRTTTGKLGHNWYGVGGGGWAQADLTGSVASDPHAVVQSNGVIDVFYRTTTGTLGHNWFVPGGGSWAQGDLPGSVAGTPSVVTANGVIDVFYRTTAGKLGHNWYVPGGSWGQGDLTGSVAGEPSAVVQPNGTIDVFYRTSSNTLGHNWYPPGGSWGQGPLGGNIDPSASMGVHAVVQANGTIDVFYRTPTGTIGHHWFSSLGWKQDTLAGSL